MRGSPGTIGQGNGIAPVVLGFPIALVLAWAFELTPEGIKRVGSLPRRNKQKGQIT